MKIFELRRNQLLSSYNFEFGRKIVENIFKSKLLLDTLHRYVSSRDVEREIVKPKKSIWVVCV